MFQCPHCQIPLATTSEMQTHLGVKHNEDVPTQLLTLYLDMRKAPDNLYKRLAYFEALADARLTECYGLRDELRAADDALAELKRNRSET